MMGFNQTPNRLPPKLPTNLYKTYRIIAPLSTHHRRATCAEVECDAYTKGWTYKKSDLEAGNLLYAVTHAGKRYHEATIADDEEIYLVFEPGQSCFQASTHTLPLERPEFFYAGRGDYRSFSTRRATQFTRPDDWQDSFAHHLDDLKTEIDKGY